MTEQILAVSKAGVNVLTATNPNDFIFHSSYNTFKIIYTEKVDLSVVSGTSYYRIAHNTPLPDPSSMYVMVKFPDGKTTLVSYTSASSVSYDASKSTLQWSWDDTYLYLFASSGSSYTLSVRWYVFETPLS